MFGNGSNYPINLESINNLQHEWVLQWVLQWKLPTSDAMGATTDWVLDSLHRTEGSRNPSGYGR